MATKHRPTTVKGMATANGTVENIEQKSDAKYNIIANAVKIVGK